MCALRGSGQKRIGVYGGCLTQKVHTQKKEKYRNKNLIIICIMKKLNQKISNLLYLEIYLNLMLKYTGITEIK